MASAAGMIGSCGAASSSSLTGKGVFRGSRRQRRSSEQASPSRTAPGVRCAYGSSTLSSSPSGGALMDQYRTLRIQPGASEGEVKKAFRQLALQYHPDVCKGNNCVVQFHQINEAYDMVMNSLRSYDEDDEADNASASPGWTVDDDDQMRGMYDPTWDLWEEWMGFEGAGGWDYTSHINPYI